MKDAAMGPVRDLQNLNPNKITRLKKNDLRPVDINDILQAMERLPPSVNKKTIRDFEIW